MRMRRWAMLGCVLGAVWLAGGCSGEAPLESRPVAGPKEGPAKKSRGVIGVSVLTTTNPFFVTIGEKIRIDTRDDRYIERVK